MPPRTSFEPDAVTREVVAAAQAAHRDGYARLASAEGFIRQILGWREYVRGINWTRMPGYLERNACPFTTLYWDFLMRHESTMAGNPRIALQVKNVGRLTDVQKQAVSERAAAIRRGQVGVAHD